MKLVSNTGPIIGLAKIGKLDLLKILSEEVVIPPFVQRELFGRTGSEMHEIEGALAVCRTCRTPQREERISES